MTAINKFNKSMIYTIRTPCSEKYYIGSTTQKLCKRFSDHNIDYKRYLKGTFDFISSFKILELGDAYIELLEEINCENRNQLEKREGELIREHKANCVNHYIPGRTQKEWNTDNWEKLMEYKKEYALANSDKIKQYRINNSDKQREYMKEYRFNNSEKIKEQKRKSYTEKKLLKDLATITI